MFSSEWHTEQLSLRFNILTASNSKHYGKIYYFYFFKILILPTAILSDCLQRSSILKVFLVFSPFKNMPSLTMSKNSIVLIVLSFPLFLYSSIPKWFHLQFLGNTLEWDRLTWFILCSHLHHVRSPIRLTT